MLRNAWRVVVGLALAALAGGAGAQDFPKRPITIVVPFAAGGPTDTVARLVAQAMTADLQQPVLVENVAGSGGTVGAARVASAPADGYTLLLHHIGLASAPSLYRKLPFDPQRDFAPIGLVTEVPMMIVARKDFPAQDARDLVAYVKGNRDKVALAHAGLGSASHLCGMLFMTALGTELTTVPYQGTGPAMDDLVAKEVDLLCDQTTNTSAPIRAGKIRVYAVTVPERIPSLPKVPTLREAGVEGADVAVWHGLYAPAGTPAAVVGRLATALQVALADRTVEARFARLGGTPVAAAQATPEALAARLRQQIELWRPIIREAGVYAD